MFWIGFIRRHEQQCKSDVSQDVPYRCERGHGQSVFRFMGNPYQVMPYVYADMVVSGFG